MFLFTILIFFTGHFLMAQPACLNDAIYALTSLREVPKAKNYLDKCFPGNESSPDAWLVRGNVFIQYYEYELERKNKDSRYVIKVPDALIIANESFYKALELKPDIKASRGLFDPKEGQLLTAAPISDLAHDAMKNENYAEAIRLLNLVVRSYKADTRGYALSLAYAYLDLADCYYFIGDATNQKKILLDAAKLNVALPDIYLNLYDLYIQEKDTLKCGEILVQARKILPDSLTTNIKIYELDYFSMIGDTAKLKNAAIKMFEDFKENPAVISIITNHLINIKEYILAENMLNEGLRLSPDDVKLLQQMAYRFNCEALDFIQIKDEKLKEKPKKYTDAEKALNKANDIFEVASVWAEKAYIINPNDRDNNIMYSRILVRLNKEVPQELQEKVDSYFKQH